MSSLNPFHVIYYNESTEFAHAHTLRSTFLRKLWDTFSVFAGTRLADSDEEKHVGLLDYGTLFIPRLIDELLVMCFMASDRELLPLRILSWIGIAILIIPAFVTNVVRYPLAAILTILFSPLVAGIHLFSKLIGVFDRYKINNLVIEHTSKFETHFTTLGEFLDCNGMSLDDIDVDYTGSMQAGQIKFRRNFEGQSASGCPCCLGKHVMAYVEVKNNSQDEAVQALLAFNVGRLSHKMEAKGYSSEFFKSANTFEVSAEIIETCVPSR